MRDEETGELAEGESQDEIEYSIEKATSDALDGGDGNENAVPVDTFEDETKAAEAGFEDENGEVSEDIDAVKWSASVDDNNERVSAYSRRTSSVVSVSKFESYDLKIDPSQGDRASEIKLCSFKRPHMRAFHYAWWCTTSPS